MDMFVYSQSTHSIHMVHTLCVSVYYLYLSILSTRNLLSSKTMRTISKTCIEVASVTVPWHQCNQCNIINNMYIYIYVVHIYIYITLGSPCASKSRLLGAVASKLSTISASVQGRRQHQ